jgi:glycosyltransferase involved in cell wall biosynthesis
MDVSVLICTFNRESALATTLDSLGAMDVPPDIHWEVVVVDNNSCDGTREVIEARMGAFPAPLRRIFEPQQGKGFALNTGMAACSGHIIAFTDDDVRVPPYWLEAAVRPLLERSDIAYTGGPVHPSWEATPPRWLAGNPGLLWGPIALLHYGHDAFIFEERRRVPLGVNMAVRRSLIDAVGGFHHALDRRGSSLMGQAQVEFFARTRAVAARGLYVPRMELHHHVPASRMTLEYYRRWWYWKGIARAILQDLHPVSELGVDLRTLPHFAKLPRFMWGDALRDVAGWLGAVCRRDAVRRTEREMRLSYFLGYLVGRRRHVALEPSATGTLPLESPSVSSGTTSG